MNEVLTGTIGKVVWVSPEEGNGYTIAKLRNDGQTVKGVASETGLTPGLTYTFQGQWKDELFRGVKQKVFHFTRYTQADPHTREGVIAYLSKYATGIGPVLAGRLFDAYGGDAAKVLRSDWKRTAAEIPGLSAETAETAAAELQKNVKFESVRIDLAELFSGRGFSRQLPGMVIRKWGIEAAKRIRRDPFCLLVAGFPSVGFARCDQLYMALGCRPWRLKRLMLCIWHLIRSDMSGHTWHDGRKIIEQMRQQASVAEDIESNRMSPDRRIHRAIELGVRSEWLALHRDADGRVWIAEGESAKAEEDVIAHVHRLSQLDATANATPEENDSRLELLAYAEAENEAANEQHWRAEQASDEAGDLTTEEKIARGRTTGVCQFCGRRLLTSQSQFRGYGPICAAKNGLPWSVTDDDENDSGVSESLKTHIQEVFN